MKIIGHKEEDFGTFDLDRIQLPTLLFQTGYLTIQDYDPRTKNFHLAYPNKEVFETMIKILAPILTGSLAFDPKAKNIVDHVWRHL
ncbi:MAG: hypothetical protein I8H75_01750 [Myxococcaceae bacterium]|nr:hypothetical protein [Myxococcaceae bacterium]MBH2006063.1 hypothetical protein [Myxococcaceae bacterium]